MSLEGVEPKEIQQPEKKKQSRNNTRHKHRLSTSHSQEAGPDYQNMKVYPVSNKASRERLKKKIQDSKVKDTVLINWDAIMA